MQAVSRKIDTAMVAKGWWDGGNKRQKTPVVKRKNLSRPEQMYALGYTAAQERKSYSKTMDDYRELLEQEKLDASVRAVELAEKNDGAQIMTEVEEEGDAVFDAVADLEEEQGEGQDTAQEQEAQDEGEDLTLEEETRIEEFDVEHELLLLSEEEDNEEG